MNEARLLLLFSLLKLLTLCAGLVESEFRDLQATCELLKKKTETISCILKDVKHDQKELDNKYRQLRLYADDVVTYNRVENLELIGIPKTDREQLMEILRNVSRAINIPFNESHISAVWRKEESSSDNYYKKVEQQSIIVRFVSRELKDRWLKKGRDLIVIPGAECLPRIPGADVYINEHLSNAKKSLMKSAKRLEETRKICFAWLKDGHVYIRITPTSKAVKIKSMKDFENLGLVSNL